MTPETMYLAVLMEQYLRLADPERLHRAAIRQDRSPGWFRRWLDGRRSRRTRVQPVPAYELGGAA